MQQAAVHTRPERSLRRSFISLALVASICGWAAVSASRDGPLDVTVHRASQRDFDGDGRAELLLYSGDWWGSDFGHDACRIEDTVAHCRRANPNPARARCYAVAVEFAHTANFRGTGFHDILANDWIYGTYIRDVDGLLFIPLLNDQEPNCDALTIVEPSWHATHVGDFNGDGRADIVWRNATTGTTALWLLSPTLGFGGGAILPASGDWSVTHLADFDGNGRTDLLWRNGASGAAAIWLMDGLTFIGGSVVLEPSDWRARLVGDFDGDGRADIVWHNRITGQTAIWLMEGNRLAAGAIVVSNADWTPTHVADLNGDGRDDLIWRHAPTGAVHAWLMDALTMMAGGAITLPGSTVVATGDYNGDGRADIVWRNANTYAIAVQRMSGLASIGPPIPVTSDPTAGVVP